METQEKTQNRLHRVIYTLSFHKKSIPKESHLDLFIHFANNSFLNHYYLSRLHYRKTDVNIFTKGSPHRLRYLFYSGSLSQNRGNVRVLIHRRFIEIPEIILSGNPSEEKNWPETLKIFFIKNDIVVKTDF